MTIYHGTDGKSTDKILEEKILKGNEIEGPGICLTIERAIEFAEKKCGDANLMKDGRIIVIENIPSQIINTASKHSPESFTLNDELGNPSKGLNAQRIKVLSMKEAMYLKTIEKNEFKTPRRNVNADIL